MWQKLHSGRGSVPAEEAKGATAGANVHGGVNSDSPRRGGMSSLSVPDWVCYRAGEQHGEQKFEERVQTLNNPSAEAGNLGTRHNLTAVF